MRSVNILKGDLKKIILSPAFLLAVSAIFALSFTAEVWRNHDTGKSCSVLEAIFMQNYPSDICSAFIFKSSFSGYLPMFVSTIAALPAVSLLCGERKSGALRFNIIRCGNKNYCLSKFAGTLIGSGLSVALGRALFGILVYLIFPPLEQMDIPQEIVNLSIFAGSEALTALANIISAFWIGAISAMPAFFLCAFCSNPYINACIPCLIFYILEQFAKKFYSSILTCFLPSSFQYVFYAQEPGTVFVTVISGVLTAALAFAGFAVIFKKHVDIGGIA